MILFSIQIGIILLVIARAFYETYMNNIYAKNRKPVYSSFLHSNQHCFILFGIMIYQITNLYAFTYFITLYCYDASESSLIWIKVMLLNIIFLYVIEHIKQERLNKTERVKLKDLFKF